LLPTCKTLDEILVVDFDSNQTTDSAERQGCRNNRIEAKRELVAVSRLVGDERKLAIVLDRDSRCLREVLYWHVSGVVEIDTVVVARGIVEHT